MAREQGRVETYCMKNISEKGENNARIEQIYIILSFFPVHFVRMPLSITYPTDLLKTFYFVTPHHHIRKLSHWNSDSNGHLSGFANLTGQFRASWSDSWQTLHVVARVGCRCNAPFFLFCPGRPLAVSNGGFWALEFDDTPDPSHTGMLLPEPPSVCIAPAEPLVVPASAVVFFFFEASADRKSVV